ncbi:uncharacterized protein LOC120146332 [Hibiscus syriacus]|uniref:uncharacterized protein LOC120146332 n=1 Tax=Hibiscus syriacus TaxID=106335 RepID=UPI001920846F|nr:uncharacterized protein LOC120146332 [Hibiscus syriacus]
MADFNNSGSNKRRRPRRKADSDQQEASNELPQQNKDAALRERKNNCWISVENLVCNFTGDNIIRTTNLWDGRKVLIEKANKLLNDPLFILQKLRNSIEPSIMENTRVKTLLQEVELTLKLSKNTVPVQDSTDEINSKSKNPVPIQDYTDGINDLDKGIQMTREELQFLSEQIKQAILIALSSCFLFLPW